ncbi:aminomethyl-transferring glycine dehydrogenase [Rubritalea marina]|uniref:aminomethyl-transferring glycine dehydrogenase n=1 Tax=Rubritalea marina TaxID=361055 RepID=UPI00035E83C0|nr:aminomethyl-transferring glycine dehydrogenase [Rubritalea marina]
MSELNDFCSRHVGVHDETRQEMIEALGYERIVELIEDAVPAEIRDDRQMHLPAAMSETDALDLLKMLMAQNELVKPMIGQGYYGTKVPAVIQRNVLENPGWYTAYTPYQAEIAQGRLEALFHFQSMVTELTGLDIANSSLLDEATAAAEAVALARSSKPRGTTVFVSDKVFVQTIDVVKNRCEPLGIEVLVGDWKSVDPSAIDGLIATLVQYPDADGSVEDYAAFHQQVHAAKAKAIVAADILALTVLTPPGEFGADIAVGSTQRFGVPLGFGGPHAAYIACTDALKRKLPGRVVGLSVDAQGKKAYRLAMQTREQHIRRDKATSNICTAQVLLAVMASMYAIYHGPNGLRNIAYNVHYMTLVFASSVAAHGYRLVNESFFDTLTLEAPGQAEDLVEQALAAGFNLRRMGPDCLGLSFDECTSKDDVMGLLAIFGVDEPVMPPEEALAWDEVCERRSDFCTDPVFHCYHSETEMLRFLARLEKRDLALNESMIPLGSCTMKLNASAEMMPLTWPEVADMHPFAPEDQTHGYLDMLDSLSEWLAEITGFAAVSLQPNAGSQGEYAGLLAIRRYHQSRGDAQRLDCLIPTSAHGTNPASAVMAGFKVVPVACDEEGNIDVADLKAKAEASGAMLACLMVTYPSTHGVYEATIKDICETIHSLGGQVYMDGANMNAQVGLTSPGTIGADVCHLNLHKTFCIPHGGGGPGVGPIGVAEQLVPFLPGHHRMEPRDGAVCAAAYGSASINVISWMYIVMMGAEGLSEASKIAILNANYMALRLREHFPILYTGNRGLVAHECIIDIRPLSEAAGISVEDVAKRLIDYGFHAPTMSWPVAGTLMIEPTESESKREIDRFCDALISIHGEIQEIIQGQADAEDNVLKHAPHTAELVSSDAWPYRYSREKAAYPMAALREHKFWPHVGRIDNVYGDRNLVCSCVGMEAFAASQSGE